MESGQDPSRDFTEQELNKYLNDLPPKTDPTSDAKKAGSSKAKW